MRYLTLVEVLELYRRIMQQTGGLIAVHSFEALEASLAQPRMTFGDQDLYPTLVEKASALAFSLVKNHPFVDGNKRVGHAALEVFLLLNGHELVAPVDEQEQVILQLAAGDLLRQEFTTWLVAHVVPAARQATKIDSQSEE